MIAFWYGKIYAKFLNVELENNLQNIFAEHICRTYLQNIFVEDFCRTYL
jgi:hypothetical protein